MDFRITKNLANFEAFRWNISSSINIHFFLKSALVTQQWSLLVWLYYYLPYICTLQHKYQIFQGKRGYYSYHICKELFQIITLYALYVGLLLCTLGIQIRNMKMVFNTYGTGRWVMFEKLMMKIYDFVIRLSRLVTPYAYNIVQKSLQIWKIFYTILYGAE